ncbi:hypothetical protein [Clostridium saccharobutylicum]|uniref:Transposase InsH N-terminal domain-containing protein n=1 Tax=Clostridium saccharobutylicum TaxID=169679 RepID=A0A1S8N607_CLOSA|nr:hypothetical protein [Clostridium saccharobutylicum]OOM11832.1 hypothetical protein CLOSAC_22590 [Clostridium saccharobutylicum]
MTQISLNIKSKNNHYKIFKAVKIAFDKLNLNIQSTKGLPHRYSDGQIVTYILYDVKSSMFSLRELECRIKQDVVFRSIIQLNQVPDYSTFSLRTKILEKHIYYGIYVMFVKLINPETKLCAIDGSTLRISKYDSEAKFGKINKMCSTLEIRVNSFA